MIRKLLIATLALLAWSLGTADAQTMDRILSAKKVKVGFIPSPPSTIKDPKTGDLSGFYVERSSSSRPPGPTSPPA